MKDETKTEKETYTLNSEESNFDKDTVVLNLVIPEEEATNPYQFTIYDVSQITNNQLYNGLFVFMKKTDDNGDDFSTYGGDKSGFEYSFDTSEKIQLSGETGYTPFDGTNDTCQSFIILYHDNSDDDAQKLSCAVTAFSNVPAIYNDLIANGNFIQTMELIAGKPKKLGTSFIPKK